VRLPVYHFPFDISVCKFKKKELCGEANKVFLVPLPGNLFHLESLVQFEGIIDSFFFFDSLIIFVNI